MTMTQPQTIERLPVNEEFARPAGEAALERAAEALRNHNIDAHIVDGGDEARDLVLSLVPEGAEVSQGASATLQQIGLTDEIENSGRYDAIRPRTRAMDRATQMREIRKLGAAPDVFVNSAAAVTEDGRLLVASATGSQIGPIAFGAGKVIFVVGAQKVVPDLDTAMRRLDEYSFPLEDEAMQKAYGRHSSINKVLVVYGEYPGRVTVVLVREPIGR
jgi:acyl-CoA hydrolase